MTSPTATCEVFIDGTRLPDKASDLYSGKVTGLSGLALTWGRDGQNEQPGPASCTLDILDPAGNDNILDVLHVGSDVQVWAEGHIPGATEGWAETVDDPTMNTWPLGDAHASGYAAVSQPSFSTATVVDDAGRRVVELARIGSSTSRVVDAIVGPRRFSPPATLPDAWDDIPQYDPSQDPWRVTVAVLAPPGAQIQLQNGIFPSPYSAAYSGLTGHPMVTATGDWQTITGPFTGPTTGWAGARVVVDVGWRWNQQTTSWEGTPGSWDTVTEVQVDTVSIERPTAAVSIRRVLTFSGEISDVTISPEGDGQTTVIKATAMDIGAALGHTMIGDSPWPVQSLLTRANRVTQLAGITASPRIRIDPPLDALQVSYRDVDSQAAYELLQDLAQTGGGVLWAATHALTGAFLWIENPAGRAAVQEFILSGGVIVITGSTKDVRLISACDLLEDPTTWRQDTSDVLTTVAVSWLEQGVDEEMQPMTTERTETVTDPAGIATYGTRRMSVSTELITAIDAAEMAGRILAQARAVAWRLEGLEMDTALLEDNIGSLGADVRQTTLLDLLDGTTRMGMAITLVDMPSYAPRGATSSAYVEGGNYAFTDGFWALTLSTSPSSGQGDSATWADIASNEPTWRWNQWSPDLVWTDAFGVAVQ